MNLFTCAGRHELRKLPSAKIKQSMQRYKPVKEMIYKNIQSLFASWSPWHTDGHVLTWLQCEIYQMFMTEALILFCEWAAATRRSTPVHTLWYPNITQTVIYFVGGKMCSAADLWAFKLYVSLVLRCSPYFFKWAECQSRSKHPNSSQSELDFCYKNELEVEWAHICRSD